MGQTIYVDDRLEPADRTAFVSQSFVDDIYIDDTNTNRFSTIQAAIDFVYSEWGPITDPENKAVILVGPGKYTEQIHSYENITIASYTGGFDTLHTVPSATLYNTGADAAHYPLGSDEDEVYDIVGIAIKTDVNGVFGKIPNSTFTNCLFQYGEFIERDSSALAIFSNCSIKDSDHGGFNFTGTNLTGYRNIILTDDCAIGVDATPTLLSTHTGFANFKCTDMDLRGALNLRGDWDLRMNNGYTYRTVQRNVFGTTGSIKIMKSSIINGIHFVSNPALFTMIKSSFEDISDNKIPDGEADITSDVIITDAEYLSNVQHNGISGKIQVVCPIKPVGCKAMNRYFSLQDAIDSIAVKGTIDIWESLTGLSELTINANTNVTIDGHKTYSLTFDNDIVELTADQELVFFGLTRLTGGHIEVNGNNAYVGFEECLTVAAYVILTSGTGTYCLVYTSTIKGPTGHPAITLNNTDSIIVAGYSRIDGGVGHPAILITVEADGNIKLKYSTLLHGTGGANAPLIYTGANKVDIAVYSCALNAVWDAADFTNLIGTPNNTADAQINF